MNEQFAKSDQESAEIKSTQQLVGFVIGEELFGVDILTVQEIIRDTTITAIPDAPDFLEGVINLRGSIIPVIDINKKFGYDYTGLTTLSRIIVCTFEQKMTGILVDRVLEVARIPEDEIEGAEVQDLSNQYISGVGRSVERIFLILNPSTIFTGNEE